MVPYVTARCQEGWQLAQTSSHTHTLTHPHAHTHTHLPSPPLTHTTSHPHLIATSTWEKAHVIKLKWFHAQRTLCEGDM